MATPLFHESIYNFFLIVYNKDTFYKEVRIMRIVVATLTAAILSLSAHAEEPIPIYDIPLSEELQQYTYQMCVDYDCEEQYELMLALMWKESNYTPDIISKTNDYGLMQINVCNHKHLAEELDIDNFLDPEQNIKAGVYFFSQFLEGNTETEALMIYANGPSGAAALWESGIYNTYHSRNVLEKKELIINNLYYLTI